MRFELELDGQACALTIDGSEELHFRVSGALEAEGSASIVELAPDFFSLLLGDKSYSVQLLRSRGGFEAFCNGVRHEIAILDRRDRRRNTTETPVDGVAEIRAQMPGKIIKLAVRLGETVVAGQSLIVIEAMKMQNELKSSKDGIVSAIDVSEGATVDAGQRLVVVQ